MHKIWVSDDDNAIRIILEESLSSSGFDVKTFSSGDDVVNELKNDKPCLLYTSPSPRDRQKSRMPSSA